MSSMQQVREEIEVALNTFTAEGLAEDIGFDAGPAGITAEVYGENGTITGRYKVTITVEKII